MPYRTTIGGTVFGFADFRDLMVKATPERSGDQLAGIAAYGPVERLAARWRSPICRSRPSADCPPWCDMAADHRIVTKSSRFRAVA